MNIKKLFAILAGVSMVANVVLPGLAHAATPDTELGKAYEWAYSKSITTMPSYEAANMKGKVTRAELAKMLSNWAMNVRGMTPDTSKTCEFTDTASVKGDLGPAIKTSCQLGLMGQGIPAFRPYDNVSRAEFGTALSRALWGGKYDGGTPYYKNHLQALQAAGIMNYIDGNWPASQEVRGYVMLMLMRVAEGWETVDPETPSEEVVKSGSLVVSSSAANERSVIVATDSNAVSDLDTLTFKTSEEVTLNKVVLEKYGYAGDDLIKNVWLENEEGKIISNTSKPNQKGLVNLTLKKDYKKVDGSFNAVIVVETYPVEADEDGFSSESSLKGSTTLGFKVKEVSSTAKDVDLGSYKPYTYNVVLYDGSVAKVTAKWGTKEHNYEGKAVEVSKFKIKAPDDSAIKVTGFTLTNAGNLDIYDVVDASDVEVSIDGKAVKATVSINKDEEMSVSLKDAVEISAKQQIEVVITTKFNSELEDYGNTVKLEIAKSSDLSATDKNNSRITVNTDSAKWVEYVINGGKVRITNTKLGNVEASINSTDILIASGYITVGEDLEKGTLKVKVTWEWKAIETMRLEIAGDEYDGTPNGSYSEWTFDNIEITESGKIRLYVDIIDKVEYKDKVLNFSIEGWDSLKYVNGSKDSQVDISGSLTVSKLTLTPAEGTLTNTLKSSDDVEFPNNELNTETVLDGTYTADKLNINLNSFTVSTTAYTGNSKVKFYLYVDNMDTPVADVTVTSGALSGADTFNNILVEAGKSVKVKVEAEIDAKETATLPFTVGKFNIVLEWEDENDNDAGQAERKTVNIVIVEKGSVSVTDTNVGKKVILRKGSTDPIAEFRVQPDGANSVTLETVNFTLSGLDSSYEGDVILKVNGSKKKLTKDWDNYSAEFSTTVNSEWVVVTVELDEEVTGEVELTNLVVNGKEVNKTFKKRFEDAVIWFESFTSDDSKTYFKFGLDKNSKDSVENVKLVLDNWDELPIEEGNEISAAKTYDVNNLADAPSDVVEIRYTINGGDAQPAKEAKPATCTAPSDAWTDDESTHIEENCTEWFVAATEATEATPATEDSYIKVLRADYPDMFRVGKKDDGKTVFVKKAS